MAVVAMTGVTSFTGCHIGRVLHQNEDFEVTAFLTRAKLEDYPDQIRVRLSFAGVTNFVFDAPFGSAKFLTGLSELAPDVFINHGAPITGYRSPTFDIADCVTSATQELAKVVGILKSCDARMIHTGSIFESFESRGWPVFSPYGKAKTLIHEKIVSAASAARVGLTQIIIPDPVGMHENRDRLGPGVVKKWREGQKAEVHNPDSVWDRLPAPWLAKIFARAARGELPRTEWFPSAFSETNSSWVERLGREFEKAAKVTCPGWNFIGTEKISRTNTDVCLEMQDSHAIETFLADYMKWLQSV